MSVQTTTPVAERRYFAPVSSALIVAIAVTFSLFVQVGHTNFWAQLICLVALGLGGLAMGVKDERKYESDYCQKGPKEAGLKPVPAILGTLVSVSALWLLLVARFAVGVEPPNTSYVLMIQVAFVFAAITALAGAHYAFRPTTHYSM